MKTFQFSLGAFLLLSFFGIVFVDGYCFPEEERVELDPLFDFEVNIGYKSDTSLELVTDIIRIILTEKLGVKTSRLLLPARSENDLQLINNGDVDMMVKQSDVSLADYPNIRNVGSMGLYSKTGWYIPEYLYQEIPETKTYLGLINALRSGETCPQNSRFYDGIKDVLSTECTSVNGDLDAANNCIAKIKDLSNLTECPLTLYSSRGLGQDSVLIKNLGFGEYVNMSFLGFNPLNFTEHIENKVYEQSALNERFMVTLKDPSKLLSKKSRSTLTEVLLPEFTSECEDSLTSDDFNCTLPTFFLSKLINSDLENVSPAAFKFLTYFTIGYQSNIYDLMYEVDGEGKDHETTACNFIKNNPNLFSSQIPEKDVILIRSRSMASRIGLTVLACAFICFGLTHIAAVFYYRADVNIKVGSYTFLIIMTIGAFVFYSWLVSLYFEPSNTSCIVQSWLYVMGFFATVLALLIKTLRISIVFKSAGPKSHIRVKNHWTDSRLMIYYGLCLLLIVIYMLVWTLVSPPKKVLELAKEEIVGNHVERIYEAVCKEDQQYFSIIVIVFQLLTVLGGVLLSVLVRRIPSAYNESKFIAASCYVLFINLAVEKIIFYFANMSLNATYFIQFFFNLVSVTNIVCLVVTTKIYHAILEHEPDLSIKIKTSSNTARSKVNGIRSTIKQIEDKSMKSIKEDSIAVIEESSVNIFVNGTDINIDASGVYDGPN